MAKHKPALDMGEIKEQMDKAKHGEQAGRLPASRTDSQLKAKQAPRKPTPNNETKDLEVQETANFRSPDPDQDEVEGHVRFGLIAGNAATRNQAQPHEQRRTRNNQGSRRYSSIDEGDQRNKDSANFKLSDTLDQVAPSH